MLVTPASQACALELMVSGGYVQFKALLDGRNLTPQGEEYQRQLRVTREYEGRVQTRDITSTGLWIPGLGSIEVYVPDGSSADVVSGLVHFVPHIDPGQRDFRIFRVADGEKELHEFPLPTGPRAEIRELIESFLKALRHRPRISGPFSFSIQGSLYKFRENSPDLDTPQLRLFFVQDQPHRIRHLSIPEAAHLLTPDLRQEFLNFFKGDSLEVYEVTYDHPSRFLRTSDLIHGGILLVIHDSELDHAHQVLFSW